jgi:tetratricopeptide (TPR) repeat protein
VISATNELLAKAMEYMDMSDEMSEALLFGQKLARLDQAILMLRKLEANEEVQKLIAECVLEKNELCWTAAEENDLIDSNLEVMFRTAEVSIKYCEDSHEKLTWAKRIIGVCGAIIDNSEHISCEVAGTYLAINLAFFINGLSFDKSVTVERALRCADLMNKLSQDNLEIALAQWMAGCAVLCIGKTENKRKAVRLLMGACRDIKQGAGKFEMDFVAVGEGYIADYHFQREEYELAEQWYQVALEHMKTHDDKPYCWYFSLFSDRIEDCQNRM